MNKLCVSSEWEVTLEWILKTKNNVNWKATAVSLNLFFIIIFSWFDSVYVEENELQMSDFILPYKCKEQSNDALFIDALFIDQFS